MKFVAWLSAWTLRYLIGLIENSWTFQHFWNIWNFILFIEDDSALKIASRIRFRGLVAHELVACKKKYIYRAFLNTHSLTHWLNIFGKLLLINDFHSSLLAIQVLSSSICSPVSSMSRSIYVFCDLPHLLFHLLASKKASCAQFLHHISICALKILTDDSILFL